MTGLLYIAMFTFTAMAPAIIVSFVAVAVDLPTEHVKLVGVLVFGQAVATSVGVSMALSIWWKAEGSAVLRGR